MQNSDLKNVLISAIETADNRLLSMLFAVIKSYQITDSDVTTPVPATAVPVPVQEVPTPVATQPTRAYKDDRPRRVVRVYRKPKPTATAENTAAATTAQPSVAPSATPSVAPRIIRLSASSRTAAAKSTANEVKESAVSGVSNNGGFISDLMTKTDSNTTLPA